MATRGSAARCSEFSLLLVTRLTQPERDPVAIDAAKRDTSREHVIASILFSRVSFNKKYPRAGRHSRPKSRRSRNRETPMIRRLAVLLTAGLLALTAAPILAHHSFAMFDREHQVDLEGTVQEFRFVNPHTFIYLVVKQDDGSSETWSLEGQSPAALVRGGWSSKTLKVGDELKMRIAPLRSGAPGGAWAPNQISFRDGRELDASQSSIGFPDSAGLER